VASAAVGYAGVSAEVRKLGDIQAVEAERIGTGFAELDRVLGGGFVPGSVVLIGGDPGAGKSTLLLQASTALAQHQGVLYVTGEESLQQLALRAQRLQLPMDGLSVGSRNSC
jgi:DNA repair protein RadA/Sms